MATDSEGNDMTATWRDQTDGDVVSFDHPDDGSATRPGPTAARRCVAAFHRLLTARSWWRMQAIEFSRRA
jgi:hypothetical protein